MNAKLTKVHTTEDNLRSFYDVSVDGIVVGWVKCYDSDGSWVWSTFNPYTDTVGATRAYAVSMLLKSTKEM